MRNLSVGLLVAASVAGCTSIGELPTQRLAGATLRSSNDLPAGTAQILVAGDKLTLTLAAAGISAGAHGVHLHAVGKCEAPAFTSAGPHLNPAMRQHGRDNPAGSHLGDLPNLMVDSSGTGALSIELPGTRAELEKALFDADGTALVIHAAADDYRTDPTGNSGGRIACGALIRQ
jgi:Cu-Zn family superoxide dismutase